MRISPGDDATPLSSGITPGTFVRLEFVALDTDTIATANHRTETIQLNVRWPWRDLRAALIRELARLAHHDDPAPVNCAVVPLQHRSRRDN